MERNRHRDTVHPRHRTGSRPREAARVSVQASKRTSDLASNSDPDRRSARLAEQQPIAYVALPPRLSRLSISRGGEGLAEPVACLPSVNKSIGSSRHVRASAHTAKANIPAWPQISKARGAATDPKRCPSSPSHPPSYSHFRARLQISKACGTSVILLKQGGCGVIAK